MFGRKYDPSLQPYFDKIVKEFDKADNSIKPVTAIKERDIRNVRLADRRSSIIDWHADHVRAICNKLAAELKKIASEMKR